MKQHETEKALQEFVLEQYPAARSVGLTPESRLLDDGIIDSMGVLELVGFVEERFGVALGDDELLPEHFESIAALARLVAGKRATSAS